MTRPRMRSCLIVALLFASVALAGCEDPPRVPYIKPELSAWPSPYAGVNGLELHVFETGKITMPERLLREGGNPTRQREISVPAFVLKHPREGLVVINPGLAAKAESLGGGGPSIVARMLTVETLPGETLPEQMRAAGLDPEKVRWVLLTSLGASHAGTLEAFPEATVVVARAARQHALRTATPEQLESFDSITQWRPLDFGNAGPLATFPHHVDLFADGSVVAIEAAGSTPGATIFLVRMPTRPVLLAAGLAEIEDQVRYAARPGAAHDIARWWQRIWELKRFRDLAPELLVVPGSEVRVLADAELPRVTLYPTPEVRRPAATPTPQDALRRMLR